MSNPPQIIHFNQLNQGLNILDRHNKDLIEFLNVSKGKILTLLNTVFSFLNDKSLLKNESRYSFNKYTIESKLVQTMSKVYDFYTSNFPENGRETLHDLVKEKYIKFTKFYEQNINYFLNSHELEFRFYLTQGMILLWLLEIKYDSEYYDEIIRVINGLIRLKKDENKNNDSDNKKEKNNYLLEFFNTILKFPYIKQNKEIIIHALEVNECSESLINIFNENLNNLIKGKNLKFLPDKNSNENKEKDINFGKKSMSSQKEDSYFSLIKENKKEKEKALTSISNKRKSFSNASSHKSVLSSINSSGFYTPEFKHAKRDSLRHFRRFTINNINNPKINVPSKNAIIKRSISSGMSTLLTKCEEGINHNNNTNKIGSNIITKTGPSTKSKLRIAVEGHFYNGENDSKNNKDINNEENTNSKNDLYFDNTNNELDNISNKNNIIENDTDICPSDCDEELENNIVSVDELPINPNLSMISNSNSKNIGVEPENIIQETKEEEENDDNDVNNEKNVINKNQIKILTENEIKDFFSQQFSDNKNHNKKENEKEKSKKNEDKNNKNDINNNKTINHEEEKNKRKNNNKKRNTSNNNNSLNSKKNIHSQKIKNVKSKSKSRSKSKENQMISKKGKMKNYSQNIFGMIKNNKNNKKENALKNKNENTILEPCTKGKELMNNALKNFGSKKETSKERLPTDSVAKKNLLTLYNQLKAKK